MRENFCIKKSDHLDTFLVGYILVDFEPNSRLMDTEESLNRERDKSAKLEVMYSIYQNIYIICTIYCDAA